MADKEKLIEKIRKLLALSQSPNEAEATLAMEKAHALLMEHNLELSDVEAKEYKIERDIFERSVKLRKHRVELIRKVAELNLCYAYTEIGWAPIGRVREDAVIIVGKPHNIVSTKMMLDYLFEAIDRLAKSQKGLGKTVINSYKQGIVDNLTSRIRKMIWEDQASTVAGVKDLVVGNKAELNAYLAPLGLVPTRPTTAARRDHSAYEQGHQDGDRITLNKQVQGALNKNLQLEAK